MPSFRFFRFCSSGFCGDNKPNLRLHYNFIAVVYVAARPKTLEVDYARRSVCNFIVGGSTRSL